MVISLIVFLLSLLGCVQSQLTCPDVFCPSQPTTCTCQVTGNVLVWSVADTSGTSIGSVTHVRAGNVNFDINQPYPLRDNGNAIPFNSTLTDTTNPVINATLSFTVDMSYNGYMIECVGSTTLTDNITIPADLQSVVVNPYMLLPPPNSFTSVTLSWMSSSDQQCLTGYQLVINPGAETIPISSISTTSHTLNDRMRGIQYCYNISVVDTGNRVGPSSDSQCFTLDTPLQPIIQDPSYPNGTANVTLAWMQPASSRPPVTSYQVIHNISNTGDNVTTTVPSPNITITGATLGSTYSILIIPSNTLGEGPPAQTITAIPSSTTAISMSSIPNITASFSSSVIPTESPTGGLGPGSIAGMIVGVIIVIAGIIMLIVVLILVCVTVRKLKATKPAAVSGDQPVIYDGITGTTTDPVPVTNNPSYHTVVSGDQPMIYDDITGTTTDPVPVTNNPSYHTVVSVDPNPSYGPVGFKP